MQCFHYGNNANKTEPLNIADKDSERIIVVCENLIEKFEICLLLKIRRQLCFGEEQGLGNVLCLRRKVFN